MEVLRAFERGRTLACILRPKMCHKCSIGVTSWLLGGHDVTLQIFPNCSSSIESGIVTDEDGARCKRVIIKMSYNSFNDLLQIFLAIEVTLQ